MNLEKSGRFLKTLRNENKMTQEQLAEKLGVNARTVSRWETGRNTPDLDILIELAEIYSVTLVELIDGERKSEKMNEEVKHTAIKVAEYGSEEKLRLMKKLHVFSWVGVISFIIFALLSITKLSEIPLYDNIASFCLGLSFAVLIVGVMYTSRHIGKFIAFKKRLTGRKTE